MMRRCCLSARSGLGAPCPLRNALHACIMHAATAAAMALPLLLLLLLGAHMCTCACPLRSALHACMLLLLLCALQHVSAAHPLLLLVLVLQCLGPLHAPLSGLVPCTSPAFPSLCRALCRQCPCCVPLLRDMGTVTTTYPTRRVNSRCMARQSTQVTLSCRL